MKKNIKFSGHPINVNVIPAKAGIYLLYFFCFSSSFCHCELSKKVWQSHYSFISFIFIYLLFLTRILQLVFCISFYFFIISSLANNPNPLFLYKLNTKYQPTYQRLTTDFNNYVLFLCNILPFSTTKL